MSAAKGPHDEDCFTGPTFTPPLYIQRYQLVYDLLQNETTPVIRVADFGCAEGKFLRHIKKLPLVEEISAVDVDSEALEQCSYEGQPLPWDYTFGRKVAMNLKLFKGSIIERDHRMRNLDAITCIELIEHLHPDVLAKFPQNVFGYMKPRIVVITTPNSEFNELFPQLKAGDFRHWDHKFEWTRDEFREWCEEVIKSYPEYTFSTRGVGQQTDENEHLGPCSQIAIFRKSFDAKENEDSNELPESYQILNSYNYPQRHKDFPEPEFEPFDWGLESCT